MAAERSLNAKCPFFRKDSALSIHCEGLIDRSSIVQYYRTAEDCSIQFDTFCSEHYRRCEIYDAIVKAKYLNEAGMEAKRYV